MVVKNGFQAHKFLIHISWRAQEFVPVDEYRILVNTTLQPITTNTASVFLEGEYNTALKSLSWPSTVQAVAQMSSKK
jgi:hypothetical protein